MDNISLQALIGGGYNAAWNTRRFYKVIKGSRGSKKSTTTQIELIAKMMAYPWMNCIVARRYANTLRDSVFAGLKGAAARLNCAALWRFTTSPMEAVYLPTGQKIVFRGFDDPLKLTSIQLERGSFTHLWVEEAYELESRDKLETVVEGLRGLLPNGAYRQVILTFNPWSENHWLKSTFFDRSDPDVFALTTTYRCNEFLDDDTVRRYERLYQTNPRRARIVCDGDWGVPEGLVFNNVFFAPFDIAAKKTEGLPLLVGLDFGFEHDPTALIAGLLDSANETLYLIDEYYKTGMRTREIAEMINRKGYQSSCIIADCAESRLISELKYEHGIRRMQKSLKGKGSVHQGIDKLQSLRIVCHPSLIHAKEEFYSYAYKFDKITGRYVNEPEDKNNHLMDALRYSLQCVSDKTTVRLFQGGI